MKTGAGRLPLLLLGLVAFVYASRLVPHIEGPPAFSVLDPPGVLVALPGERGFPEIHQIIDETVPTAVNEVTKMCSPSGKATQFQAVNGAWYQPDVSRCDVNLRWIPAAQRMALQIPLHPDRMSGDDWQALRGVGPRLAEAIEENRQTYGGFERLEVLERVKGVGPKRISEWRKFFKNF